MQQLRVLSAVVVVVVVVASCCVDARPAFLKRHKVQNIVPNVDRLYYLLGDVEDNATLTSFVDFAIKFEKTYTSEKEMVYRLNVFKEGVAKAKKLDDESKRIGSTATFGITMFSDITQEEFETQYVYLL